jgi:hypothetical protein
MAGKALASMVLCAGVFLAAASAQPLGSGVISGTVVDGETGDAIRKAIVTLTLQGTPRRWANARTDGSGHFQFDGLPAGQYDLRATKASEGTAIYGANHLRELGDTITLADAEIRGGITLRFLRAASVSGHVYDSDGDPVADANVELLRQGRNLGVPILTNYRGSNTDDRGEYRIPNVDPGRYYLRVTPNSRGRFGGMPESHSSILVEQYYGGARDSKEAAPIHLGGGENLADLDFHLTSEPPVQIRGQVLGVPEQLEPPQGQPESGGVGVFSGSFAHARVDMDTPAVEVRISPGEMVGPRWTNGTIAQGAEHRFEMQDMPAGRYRIEAVLHTGSKTYGATEVLDLKPGAGDIQLALAPAVDIQGSLRVEGQASPSKEPASGDEEPASFLVGSRFGTRLNGGGGLHVRLERPGTVGSNVIAEVGADGRFTLTGIPPGEWELDVTGVPPGFLKSAKFGDKDVRYTTFEIASNNENPLNIVVSMHTATVKGEVETGSSDAKRAGILLAPFGPYHNLARYYYGGTANEEGKFQIRGIAPGKYKIFALQKMSASNFRNPEAADQLDDLGEIIDVAEGATLEAHPKLIPTERAVQALQ